VQTARGARCTAGQVAIVSGVQDALDLVARVVLDRGDRVCMENPGYSGAAGVFAAYGATISAVRLDDEGMVVPGDEGHFGRHLRRMREIYAERLEVLLACARETLGGMLEISGVEAGLQTAGWLRGGLRAGRGMGASKIVRR
jgi:DNA-binding transcriptional MocR family regulator